MPKTTKPTPENKTQKIMGKKTVTISKQYPYNRSKIQIKEKRKREGIYQS